MSPRVQAIWRFPIKSHGREAVSTIRAEAGMCLPWDRTWAVAHSESQATDTAWARCRNFVRVAGAPNVAAIQAELDEATGTLTLHHPDQASITFDPETEEARFIEWVQLLVPDNRAAADHLVRVPGRGMTDSDFPSVSLCNPASHKAVEARIGHDLSIHRWRGNIWIDGLAPWEEFDWIGKTVQVGDAVLHVREAAERCMTTAANPETGAQDADVLGALDTFGHRNFTVLAEVTTSGPIAVDDAVVVL